MLEEHFYLKQNIQLQIKDLIKKILPLGIKVINLNLIYIGTLSVSDITL